jgi:hypothetical protein
VYERKTGRGGWKGKKRQDCKQSYIVVLKGLEFVHKGESSKDFKKQGSIDDGVN